MKYFKLPDLGEGLTEAEIVRWRVKAGDTVRADQIIVELETDKAVVEVPSPQDGEIAALFGGEGDIIHTGEPLVEFAGESDSGTVVGTVREGGQRAREDYFIIGAPPASEHAGRRATPAVRALARRMGVELDGVQATGPGGTVRAEDVERAGMLDREHGPGEILKGTRRAMARNMARAQAEVARVFICDDADTHAWSKDADPTLRLIRAIASACEAEPALNAWYDGSSMTRRLMTGVDLGVAVDTPDGLFVPVLRDIANRSAADLRQGLDNLRRAVASREIPPAELRDATITLSNFGTMAGRYANPVVMPPQTAIVGAGVIREEVVAFQGAATIHPMLPISLAFDHRAVTGGEAARFLKALLDDLRRSD